MKGNGYVNSHILSSEQLEKERENIIREELINKHKSIFKVADYILLWIIKNEKLKELMTTIYLNTHSIDSFRDVFKDFYNETVNTNNRIVKSSNGMYYLNTVRNCKNVNDKINRVVIYLRNLPEFIEKYNLVNEVFSFDIPDG